MQDLLVSLYNVDYGDKYAKDESIKIVRVLSPNSDAVVNFVTKHFSKGWASEIKGALYQTTPKVFIAVKDNNIIGFAAYDATAKGYFGPIGVDESIRGQNIGKALLLHALEAMYHEGYGYAIIGGVNDKVIPFYEKSCQAIRIDLKGNVYDRLIRGKYE